MGLAVAALATSLFAADFAARVVMEGNIADGNKDGAFNLLTLNKKDQKDADALVVSTATENAGASFNFWYNYAGNDADVKIRNTVVWFKPVDKVKVLVGGVSEGTYKEMINWWKDPIGTSVAQSRSWDGKYAGYASVEGNGFAVEMNPVDGLDVVLGFAPGAGVAFADKDFNYKNWGASVKYNLAGVADLPMTIAASIRDDGKDARKVIAVGADYGNNWADGFYGFLNARMLLEGKDGLKGIALDNYFKYATGALKVMARVPVIIRTSGKDDDPSYMEYQVRLEYALDACKVYAAISSDEDNAGEIAFNNVADDLVVIVHPGVQFNVGACALDLGVKVNYAKDVLNWSVPFSASLAF